MAVYTRNALPKVTVLYTLLCKTCRYLSRTEREREGEREGERERMTDVNSLAGVKVHI